MEFGVNFLPASGWTLSNATYVDGSMSITAGGSASISLSDIAGINLIPEALKVTAVAAVYPNKYSPTTFIRVKIRFIDDNYFVSTLPVIETAAGTFEGIMYPYISAFDIDLSAFTSIEIVIYSSVDVVLTGLSFCKSLSAELGDVVELGETYYGVNISQEAGLQIKKSDNSSEAVFNADVFAMRAKVDGVMTDKIYFDPVEGNYIFDGKLSADAIRAIVVDTPNLYAEKATISELTVDQLDTSDKVQKYLADPPDATDDNFQRIYDQYHEFITAQTDGLEANKVQATNRNAEPLYWTDETHTAADTEETEWPVFTFTYTETSKLSLGFEIDPSGETAYYVPVIKLGAGTGVGDNGKGFIYKGADGLYLDYHHSVTGVSAIIKITDNGIDFSMFPTIVYNAETVLTGIVQLWVQADTPTAAKTNDVWVDTDDYTRYDKTAITTETTLSDDANEFITVSGTVTLTLHAATTAGTIKKVYNVGTGIVTVAGTINGVTNMHLYPGESVELITDGTGWRL